MRLRHIPGCEEFVEKSEYSINEPAQYKGRWKEFFGNDNPIYIEIGMGKGKFICEMADKHPDINFIGIERYQSVLMKAIQKRQSDDKSIDNCYFLSIDAGMLEEIFAECEIDGIFLNFSDPWPKARYAKRRLTAEGFLKKYYMVIKPGGRVEFKTDNIELFDYSLETIKESDLKLSYKTYDFHARPESEDNVMTEYEEKFSSKGQKICKLILTK